MRPKWFLIVGAVLIFGWFLLSYLPKEILPNLDIVKNLEKETVIYFKKVSYHGIIYQKNNKPGQYSNTVLIYEDGKQKMVDFGVEVAIFDYLEIGDSIVKNSNDLTVKVFRDQQDTTLMIYLD